MFSDGAMVVFRIIEAIVGHFFSDSVESVSLIVLLNLDKINL